MSASILGQLQMGYQWVWDRQRRINAVLLSVHPLPHAQVDGAHLLDVATQAWSGRSPALMLSLPAGALLNDLLVHARPDGPAIVVPDGAPDDAQSAAAVQQASDKSVPLLWRGDPQFRLASAGTSVGVRSIRTLSADQAVWVLKTERAETSGQQLPPPTAPLSGLETGQILEGVGSLTLARLLLDRHAAWGLAGWPVDDVAHNRRGQSIEPQLSTVQRLIRAVEADASMDRIEQLMLREPLLAWRFLRHANSAGHTRRQAIESLRNGLMILGLSNVQRWLEEQLSTASTDVDLLPVRDALVMRAHLMEQLLDAGDEDDLRREVLFSGLMSQIDLFSGEPLTTAMQRVPAPERVVSAVISQQGPYAPYLRLALALEYPGMHAVDTLCTQYGLDLADVNRTLLRVLARTRDYTDGG
jgi:c-di-GMP phosphodiesterase